MLIAVVGYVLFASIAAILASRSDQHVGAPNRFNIILSQWLAAIVFVAASVPTMLQVGAPLSLSALWPPPPGLLAALTGAVVIIVLGARLRIDGWWSPLPWLRGALVATAAAAWVGANQGVPTPLLPDWRFTGTSLVLWGVCLILADIALFSSRGTRGADPSSRMVRELLRLCAALPALLIYMIGIRI